MSQLADTTRTPLDDAYTPSPFDPVEPIDSLDLDSALDAEQRFKSPSVYNDYKALTKPRITRMVVITAAIGFLLGYSATSSAPLTQLPWLTLVVAMVGTALSCMAASVFNQILERDTDALMHRTRDRPLAAKRLTVKPAMVLGLSLTAAGLGLLVGFGLYLAAALCAFTILSYSLVYTPMKRRTSLSLLVGAVPGAIPPMIGYAAATGTLGPAAWLLFAIMFVWQVPHFLAIAWLYREDYARANLAMLPVVDPSGQRTFRQTLIGCLLLLPLGILPTAMGVAGMGYFVTALICGVGFLGFGIMLVLRPTRQNARRLFLASLVYLPVVLTAMVLGRV